VRNVPDNFLATILSEGDVDDGGLTAKLGVRNFAAQLISTRFRGNFERSGGFSSNETG